MFIVLAPLFAAAAFLCRWVMWSSPSFPAYRLALQPPMKRLLRYDDPAVDSKRREILSPRQLVTTREVDIQ